MSNFGGISGEQLRQYISRIEKLEEEKRDIADNIRDAFADAKSNGFDPKVMRQLLKIRKVDSQELEEQETILDIYKHAMGMIPDFESANAPATSEEAKEEAAA